RNLITVFIGKHSWVGYCIKEEIDISHLPEIKRGILNPCDAFPNRSISAETKEWLNLVYARDYKFTTDINILFKGIKNLGRFLH
ncbi:MAG: glycosyltransferase, partial [Bacteroidota bacterium]|nr:glycosyltransferase [Bacteroidota bacterium]